NDTVQTAKTGTATVTVISSSPVTKLAVSAPSTATAGTSFGSVTVTAQDSGSATVTSYTGMVHFTSSDSAAVLPADYTFVAGDNGTHTFSGFTLKTAGSRTLTATDTVQS